MSLLPDAVVGTLDIGDRSVWFARRPGAGDPVVFLHGGLADSRTFAPMLERFADAPAGASAGAADAPARYELVAYDRRGHGRSGGTAEPFGYADMVAEAEAVLRQVVGRPAHLVGHSDGANLALLLAASHPELVISVTAFSANAHPDGLRSTEVDVPGLVDYLRRNDDGISPDGPDRIDGVVAKIAKLWMTEPTMSEDLLQGIARPVLLVSADRDEILLEHTVSMYQKIPSAVLAVVPAATHMLVEEDPDAATRLVLEHIARAASREPQPQPQPAVSS